MLSHPRGDFAAPECLVGTPLHIGRRRQMDGLLLVGGRSRFALTHYGLEGRRSPTAVRARVRPAANGTIHRSGCEFARNGKAALSEAKLCFWKTAHGNVPLADLRRMLPRLKFVITASLVCHLFLSPRPVTSQALPASTPDATQNPSPQTGNCHVVLTAPPSSGAPAAKAAPPSSKTKVPISAEQPVEMTARQCEQAGKVYTLPGAVESKLPYYAFPTRPSTHTPCSGQANAAGHTILDGGPRDLHITASPGTYT